MLTKYLQDHLPEPKLRNLENKSTSKKANLKEAVEWEEKLRTQAELAQANMDLLAKEVQDLSLIHI